MPTATTPPSSPPLPSKPAATPENTIHMLVLETDEPHPETLRRRGSYGSIFAELFSKAGKSHTPPLSIATTMTYIVDAVPSAADISPDVHAILITGSMYDAHGDDAWILKLLDLLRELWVQRPDLRFSGVCFGHQVLCRALGSTVRPTEGGGWELAHTRVDLTSTGRKLFDTEDEAIFLHQMHQDQVVDVPSCRTTELLNQEESERVRVWGSTEHTPIQGVYLTERLFTSQGHLGFDPETVRRQVQDRVESGGVEDVEHAEMAKLTSEMEHDGLLVAQAILRFFHGDDRDV